MSWVSLSSWLLPTALAVASVAVPPVVAGSVEPGTTPSAEKDKRRPYRTNLSAPPRFPAARPVVRRQPALAALLEAKEAETKLRRQLAQPDLPPLRRIELQAQVVEAVEAAGEDPLPEFAMLCAAMAGCEQLGPQKAWEQADEVIHRLYTGRHFEECIRYCKRILDSDWADHEARAWAWLRIICCHRRCTRDGTVHPLSERLMREYPKTVAARNHTKAAAGWLTAYLRDDDAIELLDRMAELHSSDPAFVQQCCQTAARICQRTGRHDHLARYVTILKALAKGDQDVPPGVRRRCVEDIGWIERTLARVQNDGKATGAP